MALFRVVTLSEWLTPDWSLGPSRLSYSYDAISPGPPEGDHLLKAPASHSHATVKLNITLLGYGLLSNVCVT